MIELAYQNGIKAGLKMAADWHREVAEHDAQGMEYSSLVGVPISNWSDLDTSVKTHEWCIREIETLSANPTPTEALAMPNCPEGTNE